MTWTNHKPILGVKAVLKKVDERKKSIWHVYLLNYIDWPWLKIKNKKILLDTLTQNQQCGSAIAS
jgi:hypothetical protein